MGEKKQGRTTSQLLGPAGHSLDFTLPLSFSLVTIKKGERMSFK